MKNYESFINEEVGVRNLKAIASRYSVCEIYFHKDLDGVTSAIAMKEFFQKYYNIKTIDCHIIQYGGLEFAVKNKRPESLAILVDFAHGKPMFTIATDHHDKQAGGKDVESAYFSVARSNVETISGEISYSDIFTPQDVQLIQTVDSANFFRHEITPDDVQNSIFKYQNDPKLSLDTISATGSVTKRSTPEKNRFIMGLVVNRLLLAYKNKRISVKSLDGSYDHINRNILECLVLDSSASLYSIFANLKHYINIAKSKDKAGSLAKPEAIAQNLSDYIERMRNHKFIEVKEGEKEEYDPENPKHRALANKGVKMEPGVWYDNDYKIITQYGGGNMFKPGSYDRYVPFKNNPEADFLCIVWAMGLIQVSCNPFKNKKLIQVVKGSDGKPTKDESGMIIKSALNLGEISKEVLAKHQSILTRFMISLEDVKHEYESSQDWKKMAKDVGPGYDGVGFKFSDLQAFYSGTASTIQSSNSGGSETTNTCIMKKVGSSSIGFTGRLEDVDIKTDIQLRTDMNTPYAQLTETQKENLRRYKISAWEIIIRNSGGHASITNIQGLNFLRYNKKALSIGFKTEKYTDVLRMMSQDFVRNLQEKIDIVDEGQPIIYTATKVELSGYETNESLSKSNNFKF